MSSPERSAESPIVLAYDLFGTILDPSSLSEYVKSAVGDEHGKAATVASKWRTLQIEYTWRLNSMGRYISFREVTARALSAALAGTPGLPPSATDASTTRMLLDSHDSRMEVFPDAPAALAALHEARAPPASAPAAIPILPIVFSNGDPPQLDSLLAAAASQSAAGSPFRAMLSAADVQRYKPARELYGLVRQWAADNASGGGRGAWLVSGNAWDVAGARAAGLRAAWVDRAGTGWVEGLDGVDGSSAEGRGGAWRPDVVVRELGEVVEAVRRWTEADE